MIEHNFSKWVIWQNIASLQDLKLPGVYCISISDENLSGDDFSWISTIRYVGMTNSKGGLKSRLKQFDNSILGKAGHGGAQRFLYKHRDYKALAAKLYVSVRVFDCNTRSNRPSDLRVMGDIAKYEYECLAFYVEHFNELPEFNDMARSHKFNTAKERDSN